MIFKPLHRTLLGNSRIVKGFFFFAFAHPKLHVEATQQGVFKKHINSTVATTTPVLPSLPKLEEHFYRVQIKPC